MDEKRYRAISHVMQMAMLGLLHKHDYNPDEDAGSFLADLANTARVAGMSDEECTRSLLELEDDLQQAGYNIQFNIVPEGGIKAPTQ